MPLVVDAFTREDIQRRNLQSLADVSLATPGLSFESYNSGLASPVIRGAAQQNLSNLEQNVWTFFDGVYLPRSYVTDLGLADLERIEVIKGPQSARYGRNAFMGAINYVPVRPGDRLEASASATGGNEQRFDGSLAIGGPLAPGVISARLAYAHTENDGSWNNSAAVTDGPRAGTRGKVGGTLRDQFSGAVRVTPVESLAIDLAAYHFEIHDELTPTYSFGIAGGVSPVVNTNCGVVTPASRFAPAVSRLYCGTFPVPSSVDADERGYGRQATINITRGGVSWQLAPQWSVNYVYGRVKSDTRQLGYSDTNTRTCPFFVPGSCVFQNVPIGNVDYSSHEVRVAFTQGTLFRATVGYYYADGDDLSQFTLGFLRPLTAPPAAPVPAVGGAFQLLTNLTTRTADHSVFGEVGLGLLDGRLRLTAEARTGRERKTQTDNRPGGATLSGRFSSTTPRFTVEYDLAQGHLLYASGAKGIRTGGFNANAFLPENRVYQPESNWTYELGSKNTFLNGRALVNAALFYVDAQSTQISSPDPSNPSPAAVQIVRNLGAFASKGFELEASARPIEPLTVRLGIAYARAEYKGGTRDVRYVTLCDGIVCPANGDIGGKTLQRQSPLSGNAGVEWLQSLPIGAGLRGLARLDVAYQGAQYTDPMNLARVAARTVTYGTLGVLADRWEVRLWGRNLLDKKYVSQAFFTPTTNLGGFYTPVLGERRTYGVTATARF